MLTKVSKKQWEEEQPIIESNVARFSRILFDVHKLTPDIWLSKTIEQLKKIDAIVYRITLFEDAISSEEDIARKAMLMRAKIHSVLNNVSNKLLEKEKNKIYELYCDNIKKFIMERIELVDELNEKIEDNFKSFDDKTKLKEDLWMKIITLS